MNFGQATQVTNPNQLSADVVRTAAIKDGEIIDADINASAAIAASKLQALSIGANGGPIPSTGVTNTEVAAAAGIVDTKLATIATAGKVSGAALTSLSSIPSGAGVIPAVNLPASAVGCKSQIVTKNAADASTTQTIAHGCGKTPFFVELDGEIPVLDFTNSPPHFNANYDGTNQRQISVYGASNSPTTTTAEMALDGAGLSNQRTAGVITWDATNIYIAWTKTGSPTGTYQIKVKAWYA